MDAPIAFRLARLVVWTGVAVTGATTGHRSLMAFGIGGAAAALLWFAIDAWRAPSRTPPGEER